MSIWHNPITRLSLTVVLLAGIAEGQGIDSRLKAYLDGAPSPALTKSALVSDQGVWVFLRGTPGQIRSVVEGAGGSIGVQVGDISSAQIPHHALAFVVSHPAVRRAELRTDRTARNDRAIRDTGAHLVQQGTPPLRSSRDGSGVLIGIVDSGIDFRHMDFRNPADTTQSRILAIWDQEDEGGGFSPPGFPFGTLWSNDDIERAIAGTGIVRHQDIDGHGTHVTGTAAGNGLAEGRYVGAAPGADIIVCASFRFLTESMSYIFSRADDLGVPAVVNYSGGSHVGPHDGESLEELAIDRMLTEKPGRALVVSAGNEGDSFIHWSVDLQSDSLWTYYHANLFDPIAVFRRRAFFSLSASIDGDLSNTQVAVGLDSTAYENFSVQPRGHHGMTPWTNIQDLIGLPGSVTYDLKYRNGEVAANIEMTAVRTENGKADLSVFLTDRLSSVDGNNPVTAVGADLFRFMARGNGRVHVWSEFVLSAESPMVALEVKEPGYRATDNDFSVVVPATANKAIAVGSHVNTAGLGEDLVVGALSTWSSRGPTADGRVKPEIVAPGENVTSSRSTASDRGILGPETASRLHTMSSGSSFSAPLVTGAIALYLQARPAATIDEIRSAVFTRAREDGFTTSSGPLPNSDWGHGKLDAFATVTSGIGVTPAYGLPENLVLGTAREGELDETRAQGLYRFSLTTPTDVAITVGSNYDAILALYRTNEVGALDESRRIVAQDFGVTEESLSLRLGPESYMLVLTPVSSFSLGQHTVAVTERTIQRDVDTIELGATVAGAIGDADEDVYVLTLEGQTELNIVLNPQFDGVLAFHRGAAVDDILPETEVRREDRTTSTETISETFGPGTYLISVAPFDRGGSYTLAVTGTVLTTVGRSDFDGDGDVDFVDFLTFSGGFGTNEGETGYDARLDLDGDRSIGFADFLLFASSFGQRVL